MQRLFENGVEHYQPRNHLGMRFEEESGVTSISLKNLGQLCERLVHPHKISVGKNCGVLGEWLFAGGWESASYLATGFGIGYGGTGPCGLAKFGEACGFGEYEQLKRQVVNLPQNWQGELWCAINSEGKMT